MSQPGNVLHLYVEVRSAPEPDGKASCGETQTQRDGTVEALTKLAHAATVAAAGLGTSSSLSQHCSPSKTIRPSVRFQTGDQHQQQPQTPPDSKQQGSPHGFEQHVSSTLCSTTNTQVQSPSGRAPGSTPSNGPKSQPSPLVEGGQRSVVTFSYIQKANVRTVENLSQPKENGSISTVTKRLSDPIWCGVPDPCFSPSLPLRSPEFHQQTGSPSLQRATLDAIGRAATRRALAEFGSPLLRCRFGPERNPVAHYNQQTRCQSWSGSPVLARTSCRVPYGCVAEPSNGLSFHSQCSAAAPWSQMSTPKSCTIPNQHQLTRQDPWSPVAQRDHVKCPSRRHSLSFTETQVMNQLSGSTAASPINSHEVAHRLAQEATKVSVILNEARRSLSPHVFGVNSDTGGLKSENVVLEPQNSPKIVPAQDQPMKMNIPLPVSHTPEAEMTNGSPSHTHGTESAANQKSLISDKHGSEQKQPYCSVVSGAPDSPAVPSRLHRPSLINGANSPLRDPRQRCCENPASDSPTPRRRQRPQYTGQDWFPESDRTMEGWCESNASDSVEIARRLFIGQCIEEAPISCSSRQEWSDLTSWREESPVRAPEWSRLSPCRTEQEKQAELKRREVLLLGPVVLEFEEGDQGSGEPEGRAGSSQSHSSSGVTGSLGDPECISPQSSQSSQHSSDTANVTSGIQSDSASAMPGPSLHCQKIARAKWEFLFGTSAEDTANSRGKTLLESATAPPSGQSSKSPTPTPPTSLPLERLSLRANHDVQHVEVELVTPPPAAPGTSPKAGIIGRTLKYSETDLDAVPLRCYRETDIDELLLADQEDADSAFGSNRSVVGTSVTGSPLRVTIHERGEGDEEVEEEDEDEEDDDDEEEEEEEEEEEVASWASVRMQGDKRKQRANQESEEEELLSVVIQRPLDSFYDVHPALKSPVLVPRRTSGGSMDTFSRHFESIMESHRAKGTSYCSLDSDELLTSSTQTLFTFHLPSLTPEVKGQMYQSARQIAEMSFAPLAHCELPSLTESVLTITGDSDATRPPSSEKLSSGSDDLPVGCGPRPGFSWQSSASLPTAREKAGRVSMDFELEQDLSDRLGLGSTDTITNGNRADLEAAKRLAKRLFHLDGFRRSDVARHLSKNNDFNRMVAEEYLRYFNFAGLTLDQALRAFLLEFALMGETQERERVLAHFSQRYLHCNPALIPTEDSVHTLTCALMLLNSDLHGHNVGKRMSCMQFMQNLEGLNDGQDFPKDLLKALYSSIKNEKLQWTIDEEELRKSFSELGERASDSAARALRRSGSTGKSLAQVSGAHLYKNGFLVRKAHADPDGKRTPRGKRGWKTFYAILKGLILYLQKGEYRSDKQLSDEDVKNAVSIHHALAMRATDYSKRPNVFYLRTADWRVYLFQAPNAEQMQSWITRINTVAAMFSAPPLPAAIGSQKKFSRPLLPGSASKLSQEEQVQSHEARFRSTSTELVELRSYPPDRKVKGRELEEFRLREEYLEFEKTRYGTYAMLLRAKLRCGEEDLGAFERRLLEQEEQQGEEEVLDEDGSLLRARSSPTLQEDSQASSSSSQQGSSLASQRASTQRLSYRQAVRK